jgi:hypothetical protein
VEDDAADSNGREYDELPLIGADGPACPGLILSPEVASLEWDQM